MAVNRSLVNSGPRIGKANDLSASLSTYRTGEKSEST